MILTKRLLVGIFLILSGPVFAQQSVEDLIQTARKLHREYKFAEAIATYKEILTINEDPSFAVSIQDRIIECENGINLLQFATTPDVLDNKTLSLHDFFLYIDDLDNKSWIPVPNQFLRDSHKYYTSIYFPKGSTTIYFSAPDESGSWNIYTSDLLYDNLWSEPRLASENLISSGDEIFPLLSYDSKELYFASNGLSGMGGYDLYISRWDENLNDWSTPQNVGFPFSSTADDILFLNTSNGLYSMFVSLRDNRENEAELYITEYVTAPLKKALSSIEEISGLAALIKKEEIKENDSDTAVTEKDTTKREQEYEEYSKLVIEMRRHQSKLNQISKKQEENRALYTRLTNEDDKKFLEEIMAESETEFIEIKASLDNVISVIQKMEMDFLSRGIIPQFEDMTNISSEKEDEESEIFQYPFKKLEMGEVRDIEVVQPIERFDYSFKVLPEGQFAENNTLPKGLIYQIQLFVVSNRTSIQSLKGLSPVFEYKQEGGKYLYAAGLFDTHSESLAKLNTVRKLGFPNAFIIAFIDGKTTTIQKARVYERDNVRNAKPVPYQIVIESFSEGMPDNLLSAIREGSSKDIAKSEKDGKIIYIIGPYANVRDAEHFLDFLKNLGIADAITEPL